MTTDDSKGLVLFEQNMIRRMWHNDEWYYSIVDVIAVLTDAASPRKYWNTLKTRAKSEGFDEAVAQIVPLKLKSPIIAFASPRLQIVPRCCGSFSPSLRHARSHFVCGLPRSGRSG